MARSRRVCRSSQVAKQRSPEIPIQCAWPAVSSRLGSRVLSLHQWVRRRPRKASPQERAPIDSPMRT